MNLSVHASAFSPRNVYFQQDLPESTLPHTDAAEVVHEELTRPGRDIAGLEKDGPGALLENCNDERFGNFELGGGRSLAGKSLSSSSILGGLCETLGHDTLAEPEGMANGQLGAGSITPGVQERMSGSVEAMAASAKNPVVNPMRA